MANATRNGTARTGSADTLDTTEATPVAPAALSKEAVLDELFLKSKNRKVSVSGKVGLKSYSVRANEGVKAYTPEAAAEAVRSGAKTAVTFPGASGSGKVSDRGETSGDHAQTLVETLLS